MKTRKQKIDLRNEIEYHCNNCPKQDTTSCDGCFFASIDMGKPDLGGPEIYSRAFRFLKINGVKGFKRNRPFGNYLNITLRKEVTCQ